MCARCVELDAQIEKYKGLKRGLTDRQALEAIDTLVTKLTEEKKALHLE